MRYPLPRHWDRLAGASELPRLLPTLLPHGRGRSTLARNRRAVASNPTPLQERLVVGRGSCSWSGSSWPRRPDEELDLKGCRRVSKKGVGLLKSLLKHYISIFYFK